VEKVRDISGYVILKWRNKGGTHRAARINVRDIFARCSPRRPDSSLQDLCYGLAIVKVMSFCSLMTEDEVQLNVHVHVRSRRISHLGELLAYHFLTRYPVALLNITAPESFPTLALITLDTSGIPQHRDMAGVIDTTTTRPAPSSTTADSTSHLPFIPPEIHRIIALYVSSADLQNYRLASRCLAEVGAEELFHTITFHCSLASLGHVSAIKSCDHLRKYVKVLVWDTNPWSIPGVRDQREWHDYLAIFKPGAHHGTLGHTMLKSPLGKRLLELADSWDHWGRYLDCVLDEKQAKVPHLLKATLLGFPSLGKVHVLNGDLERAHRGLKKLSDSIIPPLEEPTAYWRGESLYCDGSFVQTSQRPGSIALGVLHKLPGICGHLTKLRLDAVCWRVLESVIDRFARLPVLASLHLRITIRSEPSYRNPHIPFPRVFRFHQARIAFQEGALMKFLATLPELRSLRIDFSERYEKSAVPVPLAFASVGNVFGYEHIWPKLRKLDLRLIDTSPKAFISVLKRHRSTLKDLRLHGMYIALELFEEDKSQKVQHMNWAELFQAMSAASSLERVTLTGHFCTASSTDMADLSEHCTWDFADENLAADVARSLIQGGPLPLAR
jgi:hypothetical protein